jgi:hypothetical protein
MRQRKGLGERNGRDPKAEHALCSETRELAAEGPEEAGAGGRPVLKEPWLLGTLRRCCIRSRKHRARAEWKLFTRRPGETGRGARRYHMGLCRRHEISEAASRGPRIAFLDSPTCSVSENCRSSSPSPSTPFRAAVVDRRERRHARVRARRTCARRVVTSARIERAGKSRPPRAPAPSARAIDRLATVTRGLY